MTVGQLKEILAGYSNDLEVCVAVSNIEADDDRYYELDVDTFMGTVHITVGEDA
jgi:hypothetical protein